MVAHAFRHGPRAGVPHGEAFPRHARHKGVASRRAVKGNVADQRVLFPPDAVRRRANRQRPAAQSFAQVVVRNAEQRNRLPRRQESPERLPAAAQRLDVPVALQHRAEGPVRRHQVHVVLEQPRVRPFRQVEVKFLFRLEMRVPRKADQVAQIRRAVRLHLQQVAPPHQFADGPCAQSGHDLPQLFRNKQHEPLHIFRFPGKFFPQFRVLSRNAEGARAQMANPHHPASHRHQRRRGKAEFFRAQQQRHRHVVPGHQFAVRLQRNLLAQPVPAKHLVRLRQPDLPGQPRVVHARKRHSAGSAFSAADQDPAGAGLGHAAGNGSDPGRRNQFHRNFRVFIGALQVVNQFRKVFNGIDVVVRRRGNQRDPRRGAAGLRHALRHLRPGQVSALAGLGALGHLDLDLLRAQQVFPRHAEASRSNLFDRRVQLRPEAFGQFAAFAAVRFSAQMVHGLRHAFVGFLRNGSVAHGPRSEALHDGCRAFDFFDRHGTAGFKPEVQHAADGPRPVLLNGRRVPVKQRPVVGPNRLLKQMDGFRRIQVFLCPSAGAQPVHAHGRQAFFVGLPEGFRVVEAAVAFHPVQVRSAQHTRRVRKVFLHKRPVQPDGLKQLRALISLQGRNAHLRCNLQHPGAQRFVVARQRFLRRLANRALVAKVPYAVVGQVGVHRPRAEGHQQRQVMHVPRLPALQHDGDRRPLLDADQVLFKRRNRQQ